MTSKEPVEELRCAHKVKDFAKTVALSALAYARTVAVFASLVAWAERRWELLGLSLLLFLATSRGLNLVIGTPDADDLRALTGVLQLVHEEGSTRRALEAKLEALVERAEREKEGKHWELAEYILRVAGRQM
jgi:hypothetical protein